jgi:hypothetical protein
MFGLHLFRFRSRERDREADDRRLALIQKDVRSALADAEAEATGLRARIAKARRSSSFLLEQIEGDGADPARGGDLRNLEQNLLTAEARLAQLNDHLGRLRKIEEAANADRLHGDLTGRPNEKERQA